MSVIKIALSQVNLTVGSIIENANIILDKSVKALDSGAEIIVFPELSLCGYPVEDLIFRSAFLADCENEINRIVNDLPVGITCVFGAPIVKGEQVFNAALVVRDHQIIASYHKQILPNHGVFDEERVFKKGETGTVFELNGVRFAVHICEDSWWPDHKATSNISDKKVDVLLNLSASPYNTDKLTERLDILGKTCKKLNATMVYCNLVGGQDELVFDGGSMVIADNGELIKKLPMFCESLAVVDYSLEEKKVLACHSGALDTASRYPECWQQVLRNRDQNIDSEKLRDGILFEHYSALVTGLRDYVNKNRFPSVVVALSGGIDSALVGALAVDALGAKRVIGITMPSQYSSNETVSDAERLAENLNIPLHTVPIKNIFDLYLQDLNPFWQGRDWDTAEENLQARIRGNIIMAFSNKMGWLVLTTGNKSEYATGYATLYGDMCGGFAVIKDVPKTEVFELCEWRNRHGNTDRIPPSTISRPPSAELRPDQKDTDSLPPYPILDEILELYIENHMSAEQIAEKSDIDRSIVDRIVRLVDKNEYKRRQSPPGVKVTTLAFGKDRRMPITNQYSG